MNVRTLPFGKVTLTRRKGRRETVLAQDFAPHSVRHSVSSAGFDVPMPDGSEMHVRLDRQLVTSLARCLKLTLSEIQES